MNNNIGISFTALGSSHPGKVGSYCLIFGTSLFCAHFTLSFLPFPTVSLSYFVLAVSMPKCCEQHSCMSSTFSIAILYGTYSLCSAITVKNYLGGVLLN